MKSKNIGIDVSPPKETCEDPKCPFHGSLRVKGRQFTGVVLSKDSNRSGVVEWTYKVLVPKYERKETRRTRVHVHNPACINAEVGDLVLIAETRPISKTKNFVIIENKGKEKGFYERIEAKEEAEEIIAQAKPKAKEESKTEEEESQ